MKITIDEFIERFKSNAEHQRNIGDLQGCLEFRQLAEWLVKYQKIEQIIRDWKEMGYDNGDGLFMLISGVLEK